MARATVIRRIAAVVVPLALVASAFVAAPAFASAPAGYQDGGPIVEEPHAPGITTEATVVALRKTSGLYGGFVDTQNPQAPYPSSIPGAQSSHTTAQIVLDDPSAPTELLTLCIDIETDTTIGVHYELGDWTVAEVQNLPYVQWILDSYPMTAASTADEVRAAQGAIWYFSDGFVVNRFYPTERSAVRAIVEAAQAALAGGAPPAPPLPSIAVDPDAATAAPGDLTGPYTVSTANLSAPATIDIPLGTSVFRDVAGSVPVPDGAAIADGDQLWARFASGAVDPGFALEGAGSAPAGNVYLYDGNNPPRTAAQKLVLAADAVVPVRTAVEITPAATGVLAVELTIAGAAAGSQGEIELTVDCPSWPDTRPAYRVAGAPAGTTIIARFDGLPAGEQCDVTPDADGGNASVQVDSFAVSPPPPVVAGQTVEASVSAVYSLPAPPPAASLQIDATITGSAAGSQSALELVATCDASGTVVTRTIAVPAGITGTTTIATVPNLPVGAVCGITQPVDGRNADAALTATNAPLTLPPLAGGTTTATIVDEYAPPVPVVGTLAVDLTVGGGAAGEQSALALTADCMLDGDTRSIPLTAAAGLTGTTRIATIADVEADSVCTVTQTQDGANARAALSASSIAPASVEVRAGATAVVTVSNTYAAPTPTPTPTPTATATPSVLPATGSDGAGIASAGIAALAGLLLGAGLLALDILRRRATRA